ncbi:hypothetical protein D5F01_LYC03455 [Larimichthys crocea]|uniref:Uncharacterized protein n=1 Tax=Larimichthys crocea TaxID=215358 RepID=A0A6G0J651_LARCR|nr:hypothetical protein D5F01_LYC03455 [Larimichthys crocea]
MTHHHRNRPLIHGGPRGDGQFPETSADFKSLKNRPDPGTHLRSINTSLAQTCPPRSEETPRPRQAVKRLHGKEDVRGITNIHPVLHLQQRKELHVTEDGAGRVGVQHVVPQTVHLMGLVPSLQGTPYLQGTPRINLRTVTGCDHKETLLCWTTARPGPAQPGLAWFGLAFKMHLFNSEARGMTSFSCPNAWGGWRSERGGGGRGAPPTSSRAGRKRGKEVREE